MPRVMTTNFETNQGIDMQSLIPITLTIGVLAVVATWLGAYLLILNDKLAGPRRAASADNDAALQESDAREESRSAALV